MHAAILDGESIVVRHVRPEELARRMVVLCRSGGRLLAHRIVQIEPVPSGGPRIHTRGDAVGADDHPVLAGEVLGYVAAVVRGGREVPLGREPLWPGLRAWLAGLWQRLACE